ncbi:hypothetical protein PR202_gb23722 [Eleusine coracana subsp. coracana]|uniref:F-box domain-containing protein n=1 Tax=Eleusine coracana subsp. coracana TaxID=191504 RepID=A0AAV5FJM7_ELECO|nr:hypothetical protein QOZ80_5BG0438870 [Eleusine coracana subsp. coracana]GJN35001.1 hypothetical protein PR202_gb23722 [Eleusine coracana subsp. coracana]
MDCRVDGESAGDRQAADLTARLPEDVLVDVLRRLAPQDLAASRCVCEARRAMIGTRRLLRAKLLPLWLGGIFINFHSYFISELFARLSASYPVVSGKLDFLPDRNESWSEVSDHCNGLPIVEVYDKKVPDHSVDYVLNPATRWCARLPPLSTLASPAPTMETGPYEDRYGPYENIYDKYLVYDPTVSLHYKVFLIRRFHSRIESRDLHYDAYMKKLDPAMEQSEWPPSPCIIHVYSSKIGKWEERSFVQEGKAAGTIADMRLSWPYD